MKWGLEKYFFICCVKAIFVEAAILQPPTTPEFEEALVYEAGKKSAVPLSEALQQLIQGISDQTFGKDFIEKIAQAEAQKFTGEYVDYWPNGQMKIKATLKSGKVDGHVHGWYDDGFEAFKAFFYENTKVGIHLAFYPDNIECGNSRIGRLLRYDFNGKLDKVQSSGQYNGWLKSHHSYKAGVLDGFVLLYNSERKCLKNQFFENGKFVPGKKSESKK